MCHEQNTFRYLHSYKRERRSNARNFPDKPIIRGLTTEIFNNNRWIYESDLGNGRVASHSSSKRFNTAYGRHETEFGLLGPGKKRAGGGVVGRLAPREKINSRGYVFLINFMPRYVRDSTVSIRQTHVVHPSNVSAFIACVRAFAVEKEETGRGARFGRGGVEEE